LDIENVDSKRGKKLKRDRISAKIALKVWLTWTLIFSALFFVLLTRIEKNCDATTCECGTTISGVFGAYVLSAVFFTASKVYVYSVIF
jgi:hypothetical protein